MALLGFFNFDHCKSGTSATGGPIDGVGPDTWPYGRPVGNEAFGFSVVTGVSGVAAGIPAAASFKMGSGTKRTPFVMETAAGTSVPDNPALKLTAAAPQDVAVRQRYGFRYKIDITAGATPVNTDLPVLRIIGTQSWFVNQYFTYNPSTQMLKMVGGATSYQGTTMPTEVSLPLGSEIYLEIDNYSGFLSLFSKGNLLFTGSSAYGGQIVGIGICALNATNTSGAFTYVSVCDVMVNDSQGSTWNKNAPTNVTVTGNPYYKVVETHSVPAVSGSGPYTLVNSSTIADALSAFDANGIESTTSGDVEKLSFASGTDVASNSSIATQGIAYTGPASAASGALTLSTSGDQGATGYSYSSVGPNVGHASIMDTTYNSAPIALSTIPSIALNISNGSSNTLLIDKAVMTYLTVGDSLAYIDSPTLQVSFR